jgi:hypothetical protein
MNDFMAVFRILGRIVPKNQRFLFADESMRAFHNDEIVDEVVQDFQPVGQEFELIVEDEPVDDFTGGGGGHWNATIITYDYRI